MESIMYEKIRLLCVMEMTFRRDAKDRQLTFEDVAKETGLNVDLVELLVRIASSLTRLVHSIFPCIRDLFCPFYFYDKYGAY